MDLEHTKFEIRQSCDGIEYWYEQENIRADNVQYWRNWHKQRLNIAALTHDLWS